MSARVTKQDVEVLGTDNTTVQARVTKQDVEVLGTDNTTVEAYVSKVLLEVLGEHRFAHEATGQIITLSGNSPAFLIIKYVGSGQLFILDSPPQLTELHIPYVGSGTIFLEGEAEVVRGFYAYEGSGTIVLGGEADAFIGFSSFVYEGDGLLSTLSSDSDEYYTINLFYDGSGFLIFGGFHLAIRRAAAPIDCNVGIKGLISYQFRVCTCKIKDKNHVSIFKKKKGQTCLNPRFVTTQCKMGKQLSGGKCSTINGAYLIGNTRCQENILFFDDPPCKKQPHPVDLD